MVLLPDLTVIFLVKCKKGDIIVISFVGYQTQEVKWTGQPIDVTLKDDTQQLGEVVVTALGLKREEKLWDMQLLK